MISLLPFNFSRLVLIAIFILAGLTVMLWSSKQSSKFELCITSSYRRAERANTTHKKPLMLLWFWPENRKFHLKDCKTLFQIDGCDLTDDRAEYSSADAVLLYQSAIKDDLSNLPTAPRSRSQRWIWFNMDPPQSIRKIDEIKGVFNLSMTYRSDSDIRVRWQLTHNRNQNTVFVLPQKDFLLCWIVDGIDLNTDSGVGSSYYRALKKHINVKIFQRSELLKDGTYFQTISRCKFYLSFESSFTRDFITETFYEPLAVGTVPIALGPLRRNYEEFVPRNAFIHTADFADPLALAEHLLKINFNQEAYIKYFDWRQFYSTKRHPIAENHKFAYGICQACKYLGLNKVYRTIPDVYQWFLF